MISEKKQISNSILSLILSFLASSHQWLHMGMMMMLGGSTNMMGTMGAAVWIRRLMIAATLLIVIFSVYRLVKHRCRNKKMIIITVFSAVISVLFVANTLIQHGW